MNFDLVMGDKTGYIRMKNGHRVYVEYDEFSVLRSAPPVNFIIDDGAEMWASADFKVVGAGNLAFKVRKSFSTLFTFNAPEDRAVD